MMRAPGTAAPASAPAASIRLPLTRTAHPSCIVSPSKTRAGFTIVTADAAGPCADGSAAARPTETTSTNVLCIRQFSTLNSQVSTLNSQHSTLNTQPSFLDLGHET